MKVERPEKYRQMRQSQEAKDRLQRPMRRYGLPYEKFTEMLIASCGRCQLCGKQFLNNKFEPQIDHDHETKRVRGLICHRCNSWLAALDDQDWLEKARAYLQEAQ